MLFDRYDLTKKWVNLFHQKIWKTAVKSILRITFPRKISTEVPASHIIEPFTSYDALMFNVFDEFSFI